MKKLNHKKIAIYYSIMAVLWWVNVALDVSFDVYGKHNRIMLALHALCALIFTFDVILMTIGHKKSKTGTTEGERYDAEV